MRVRALVYEVERCWEICTAESVTGDVLFRLDLTTSVKNGSGMGKSACHIGGGWKGGETTTSFQAECCNTQLTT